MRAFALLLAIAISGCVAIPVPVGGGSGGGDDGGVFDGGDDGAGDGGTGTGGDGTGGDDMTAGRFDETGFLALVNDERGGASVAMVTPNALLAEAAQRHATDVFENDLFSTENGHVGSDGTTVGDRVTETGYEWAFVAENIALAPSDAQAIVAWNNSQSHRDAMLDPIYQEGGVANDGNIYVLVLATPK